MARESELRESLKGVRRLVVKVGTRNLVDSDGRPNEARLKALVDALAGLHAEGRELVLVSSGAIGAGIEALALKERPKTVPGLQMAAAVGQSRLLGMYSGLFAAHGITIGQVLLTHEDLGHRQRHLNARNTMMALLRQRVVPIVNENDVVAVEEIKFGDNDHLASLVTMLVGAELLVLLTSVDGLQAPGSSGGLERVSYLPQVTEQSLELTWGKGSALSTGGMASKLKSAQNAASIGSLVVIGDGRDARVLGRVLAGESVGTLIGGAPGRSWRSRKRWLAYFHKPEGALWVDKGAVKALVERGKSLLPVGITRVDESFEVGALVTIKGPQGERLAQGLVEYSSAQIEQIKGLRTEAIEKLWGAGGYQEVIHRDNLALLAAQGGEER